MGETPLYPKYTTLYSTFNSQTVSGAQISLVGWHGGFQKSICGRNCQITKEFLKVEKNEMVLMSSGDWSPCAHGCVHV